MHKGMQVHWALNNKCLWTLPLRSVSDQRQGGRWNFQFFPTNFQQRRLRFSVAYAYYKFCTLFYLHLKCLNRTVKFKSQDLLFQTLRMRRGMMRLNHKRVNNWARQLTAEEKNLEVNVWVVSTRLIRKVFIVFFLFLFLFFFLIGGVFFSCSSSGIFLFQFGLRCICYLARDWVM